MSLVKERSGREILPENEAARVQEKRSRLAHLYRLPKTHKGKLSMRPILSAAGTYNYKLARWLNIALKLSSVNKSTIFDPFKFAEMMVNRQLNRDNLTKCYINYIGIHTHSLIFTILYMLGR